VTQPVATSATPMPGTLFTPTYYRTGPFARLFGMGRPMYSYSSMYVSPTYSAPAQTYSAPPVQTYSAPAMPTYYAPAAEATYVPVRRGLFGLGLFQRRWSQPVYTTFAAPVYSGTTYFYAVPGETSPGVVTPSTTTTGTTPAAATRTYTPTMFTAPTGTSPAGTAPAATAPAGTATSSSAPSSGSEVGTPPPPPPTPRVPRSRP
jgi:hypothetical protein